jgi:ubiquinone/menaquinone biosynthesis C-methylase UbiE
MRHTLRHMHGNRPRVFTGRSSRVYDFAARRLLRGFYRRIAQDIAATAPDGADVLDIGTGPGVLLVELARCRPDLRLTGIDLSADMISAAGRNVREFGQRVTVRVADVTELPFPDASFDVVVSSLSLHHWDHPEAAVPELARVLRPGGRLSIYDFHFAPFGVLDAAARERSLFTGDAPPDTPLRRGLHPLPRCVKHVLTTGTG